MGGDPAASEPFPARGVAGARGGRRGRFWGSILSNCSYSRSSDRGHDGGGVFSGVPGPLTIVLVCLVVPLSIGHTNNSVSSCFGVFLSSLVDEMEGKECEREEN